MVLDENDCPNVMTSGLDGKTNSISSKEKFSHANRNRLPTAANRTQQSRVGPRPQYISSRPPRWTEDEVRPVFALFVQVSYESSTNLKNPFDQQDRRLNDIVAELFESDSEDDDTLDDEDGSSKRAVRRREGLQKDRVRDIDWAEVASRIGNSRKSAECMRRYNKISGIRGGEKAAALKGPWTAEEDKKIIDLVMAHGAKRWSQIAAELPGR